MAGHRRERIAAAEVVAELRAFLLLALDDGRGDRGGGREELADLRAGVGVLVDHLGDDVARAGERRLGVRHLLGGIDIGGRGLLGDGDVLLREERERERLEAPLAGDHGARAPLGTIRQVKILQRGHRLGQRDLLREFVGEQSPLLEGIENRLAPRIELGEPGEGVANRGDLDLVELPGGLFAIARDERNRGASRNQAGHRVHLTLAQTQRLCNLLCMIDLHLVIK